MTEEEWLTSDDSRTMLDLVQGRQYDRKLILFCVGCWSRHTCFDAEWRQLADELADRVLSGNDHLNRLFGLFVVGDLGGTAMSPGRWGEIVTVNTWGDGPALGIQAELLRDIFGNPFRPVAVEPHWLTPTVRDLAAAIYADRAFDRLPVLADALEEAGCGHADVLAHCRGPGPHARGCWVVDLLLGRS